MKNKFYQLAATVSLLVSAAHAGITISSPANGTNVGTPVHVVASASAANPIVAMKVYVDNKSVYSTSTNKIDTYISMASGWRNVVVQSWDSAGAVQKQSVNVNVAYSTSTQSDSTSGISVTSPSNGSSVGSPVHFVASSSGATAMKIYVDGTSAHSTNSSSLDTYVSMSSGTHSVTVQSWDKYGNVKKAPMTITVSGSTSTDTSSSSAFTNIDQITGWQHCDSCAGINGDGPSTPYSYTQFINSPSMDGKSMQFWLGGTTPYSNALWWKQLGPKDGATNFVYDVYFYIKDPGAAQALEFDVNQSVNGRKYIFGTECNLRNTKTWRVWDTANAKWVSTGVPCPEPSAYTWHHLVWEFKRSGTSTVFVSVTLDGKKSYINRTFNSKASSARELNVAFQMDGNYNQTDYSTWLDKVTLKYW